MNNFRIHFQLKSLDEIMPFGSKEDWRLHWFGLTDGLLWLDVGEQTLYEYSAQAQAYWGGPRYNDYQIARFLEDFFTTFRYVGESIPKELYDALPQFETQTKAWLKHLDEDDKSFDHLYNQYCELGEWYASRSFDSGHLTGGLHISCFRWGEKLKIIWESDFLLEDGSPIWTAPSGNFEMLYEDFVASITDFFAHFSVAMDRQIEDALAKQWQNIFLDKKRLVEENQERKTKFLQDISQLQTPHINTDWQRIMNLYTRLKDDTKI